MSKKGFISKLTEEIKKLPHGVKYDSPEEAIEALRRAGVKDAELEYSGLEELLRPGHVPGLGLSKTSLEMADAKRPDIFDFKDRRAFEFPGQNMPENLDELADAAGSEYEPYSLPGDNYREHIYQFSNDPSQRNPDDILNTRSYSNHFQDIPNYMGHVRSTDEIVDGKPTLNIQEVQSDVLGHSLRKGMIGQNVELRDHMPPDDVRRLEELASDLPMPAPPGGTQDELWDSHYENVYDEIATLLKPLNVDPDDVDPFYLEDIMRFGEMPDQSGYINTSGPGPDRFPNTKNYRERMLERSIDVAQDEGKEQLMVPLEDITAEAGVSPIAKNLHRGDHIQKQEYDPKKGRVPKALKKIARDQGMEYKTIEKDGVRYGLLDFKGKKKKPTELYSVGGLLGAGALNQIMQDPSQDVR